MTLMQQTIDEVAQGLARKLDPKNASHLGFDSAPTLRQKDYVFVQAQDKGKGTWYRLVGDRYNSVAEYLDPITEAALTGKLLNIVALSAESDKYGDKLKCDFTFNIGGDCPVVIRSGRLFLRKD